MGKWEMVRLGEVFKIASGGTPAKNRLDYYNKGTIPWVKTGDLKGKYINSEYVERITDLGLANSSAKLFPSDTVLIAMYGATIGATSILNFEACTNQACAAFLPSQSIQSEFLYYFLLSKKANFIKLGVGGAQPNISATILKEVKIPLPPLDEQKRIAKNLDLASEIVKGYKKQLAELDKLVQSVFYEMFGDPVTNEMGWDVTCLSEVCKKITDGTHNSPENLETGEYRYITAKNIKRDGILLSNITYVTKQVHEEIYARCNPEMGDVLYIKDGVTTGIAVVNTLNEPFSMLSSVALLKLKNTICNKYLCNALNCKEMYQKIRENMGGAAITRLTLVKIKNIEIPLPPLSLQTRFASIVTEIETQKAQIQKALSEAENLFNSLMQEYFK